MSTVNRSRQYHLLPLLILISLACFSQMQENGPFTLAYNSTEVKKSDYSWTKLSNVLWVEQPVSVGFSTGNSTATSQDEVSSDFRDFLDSFMNVFPEMKNKKLWLTGENLHQYRSSSVFADVLSFHLRLLHRRVVRWKVHSLHR